MTQRALMPWLLVLGLALQAHIASAEDAGRAAALFDRGVAEMQAGQPETGCPALDESYRLDPKPGALFTAAECQVVWGKLQAAAQRYAAYVTAVSQLSAKGQARHATRVAQARAALDSLERRIPRLLVVVPSPAPAGLRFTLDSLPLAPDSLREPVRVDPGSHTLEANATGRAAWRLDADVAAGETRRVEVRLAPAAPPAPTWRGAPPRVTREPVATSQWASLGWVLGGVGAAGVVVGSVAGISVLHQKNVVAEACSAPAGSQHEQCSARGMRAVERGHDLAIVADIGFGVGIAGLALGGLLLIVSPTEEGSPPADSAQLVLDVGSSGTWFGVHRRW